MASSSPSPSPSPSRSSSELQTRSMVMGLPNESWQFDWSIGNFPTVYANSKTSKWEDDKYFAEWEFEAGQSIGLPSKWRFYLYQSEAENIHIYLQYQGSSANASKSSSSSSSPSITVNFSVAAKKHGTGPGREQPQPEPESQQEEFIDMYATEAKRFTSIGQSWGCPNFARLSTLKKKGFLTKDNQQLTLRLQVTLFAKEMKKVETSNVVVGDWMSYMGKKWSSDLIFLLETGAFSDVTFSVVDNTKKKNRVTTLKAHKAILGMRSEVFSAMFRTTMSESESGVVVIKDMSPKGMELTLKFIYSGDFGAGDWGECAADLMNAAEKYQIADMKRFLEENVHSVINSLNVLGVIRQAELQDYPQTLKAARKFADEHAASVLAAVGPFKENGDGDQDQNQEMASIGDGDQNKEMASISTSA